MKPYVIAATFLVLSSTGFAQQGAEETAPVQGMVEAQPTGAAPAIEMPKRNQVQGQTMTNAQAVESATSANSAAQVQTRQPIVIVNQPSLQQAPQQPAAQQAPAVVIEASPLEESRAERLRRAREKMEGNTERRLVEKLEQQRLDDEKTRVNRIFGPELPPEGQAAPAPVYGPNEVPQAQVTQTIPTPAQGSQTVPAVAPVEKQPVAPAVGAAAAGDVQGDLLDADSKAKTRKPYFNGMVGLSEYPDAVNVKGHFATGFSVGMAFPERFNVEGFFTYASYDVEQLDAYGYSYDPYYPWIKNLNQYSVGGVFKYKLFDSPFTPVVGGIGAFTYRSYQDNSGWGTNQKETSTAFDVGALLGAEYKISERFAIGGDFRYMTNLGYSSSSSASTSSSIGYRYNTNTKALERINYYILGVNATFTF